MNWPPEARSSSPDTGRRNAQRMPSPTIASAVVVATDHLVADS
jgi:hypothetical protein